MREILNIGEYPDDGTGDWPREVGRKSNHNFEELYTGVAHARVDLSNPTLTASFRDDGAGNLGWYVGAAGAVDGAQIKAATVNPSNGNVSLGVASLVIQSASGNVGIGTSTPLSRLHVECAGGVTLITGGSKALRVTPGGTEVQIAATDHTGAVSFQPLTLTGSLILFGAQSAPNSDNAYAFGGPSSRWTSIYSVTGTINTSDAREKTAVRPLNAAEIRAAQRLAMDIGVYQWLEAVAEKGDAARQHIGMTVQRAIEIMEDEGLNPWAYGFMCRDEITRKVTVTQNRMVQKVEEVEVSYAEIEIRDGAPVQVTKTRVEKRPVTERLPVLDEKGKPVLQLKPLGLRGGGEEYESLLHAVPVMVMVEEEVEVDEPAGDRLGFRYDQLVLFMMRGIASAHRPKAAKP